MKKRDGGNTMLMTDGNILSILLVFALPLLVGNLFQHFYNMVDTAVAGYALGDNAIAAIGATSSIVGLLVNLSFGLNSGFSIILAQRFGAGDREGMRKALGGTLLLDLMAAFLVMGLGLVFLRPILRVMNVPSAILADASAYLGAILLGFLSTILYNMASSVLRALGNSMTSLLFLMFSSLLNIVLDVLFVMGLGLGVKGAAWATVIAQSVSAILSLHYIWKHYKEHLPSWNDISFRNKEIGKLFGLGASMALMYSVVDMGTIIFQKANNLLGEQLITAHSTARRFIALSAAPMSTIASANSTFAGQNYGAGKMDRVRKGLWMSLGIVVLWSMVANLYVWLFGRQIVLFLTHTKDEYIIENAVLSLRWHHAFFLFMGTIATIRSAMQAFGHKVVPIVSSVIELVMKILSATFLVPAVGFIGTCMTEPVIWVVMASFLFLFYLKYQSSQSGKDL